MKKKILKINCVEMIIILITGTNTDTGVVHLVPLESIAAFFTTTVINILKKSTCTSFLMV